MFYINEEIIFQVVENSSHQGTEVSTTKIRPEKRKWALNTNIIYSLLFVLYIESLNKMPEMSGKHRKGPTRDEKTTRLHSKTNSSNIAQVMTATYTDDDSILATTSSLTQVHKFLQNVVSAMDKLSKKWKLNLNRSKSELTFFHGV